MFYGDNCSVLLGGPVCLGPGRQISRREFESVNLGEASSQKVAGQREEESGHSSLTEALASVLSPNVALITQVRLPILMCRSGVSRETEPRGGVCVCVCVK